MDILRKPAAFRALVNAWLTESGYGGVTPRDQPRRQMAVEERTPASVARRRCSAFSASSSASVPGIDRDLTDARSGLRRLDGRSTRRCDHGLVDGQSALGQSMSRPAQSAQASPRRAPVAAMTRRQAA